MLVSVLLVLAASGTCLGQLIPCTQEVFPSENDLHGNIFSFGFVGLTELVSDVTFTNNCATTNGVVFHVCDDVAPGVIPTDMFNATVIRRGSGVGSIALSATHYCD